jgi:hypothetical protein
LEVAPPLDVLGFDHKPSRLVHWLHQACFGLLDLLFPVSHDSQDNAGDHGNKNDSASDCDSHEFVSGLLVLRKLGDESLLHGSPGEDLIV